MPVYEHLLVSSEGPVCLVTLNRPSRRNALSLGLMREAIACLRGEAAGARAVIVAAAGNTFSSGHDLSEMTGRELGEYRDLFDVCTELMDTIQSIGPPVIAEVQGVATAAGCQLVAACDLAVASEAATFATPGVKIGLFCTTPMVALTRAIGRKRAMEMLLTGRSIDADTAADWGLINRVVPAAELRAASLDLAGRIAAASPLTVSTGKRSFYDQIDLGQRDAYARSKETMSRNALAADAQEGISAFLAKCAPVWSGR